MRLYQLSDAFARLEALLAESEEVPEALAAELDALECQWDEKVDGICRIVAQLKADADAVEAEVFRLRKLEKSLENKAARLKDYLLYCMVERGLERCDTTLFRCRVQANSRPSIRWTGEVVDIPERYKRVSVELDGPAVYAAWKVGPLPEGFAVELGSHVRIS